MFKRPACAIAVLAAAIAQTAAYDGLYQPAGLSWSCSEGEIGMDGGAVAITDGFLHGVENSCQLTEPTAVRGMNATLYDAVCSGEGERYSYRLMLMRHEEGIYLINNGFVADWRHCR